LNLNFLDYAGEIRETVVQSLEKYRESVKPVSEKALGHLKEFAIRGKMMRGCLLVHSAAMLGAQELRSTFRAAAAIELLHSGILIIDDIIDRDEKRRGLPSMHVLLKKEFLKKSLSTNVTGEDLAMAVGLTATYIGFSLLEDLGGNVLRLVADAFALTGLAELKELHLSLSDEFNEEDVLEVYRLKTGKYSIAAPISIGAMIAEKQDLLPLIEIAGNHAGVAFQIKDDLIELEYGEEQTGKPAFSDLKAGRKNLAIVLTYQKASTEEKHMLAAIFHGGGVRNPSELKFILDLFKKYSIQKELNLRIEKASMNALNAVAGVKELEKIFSELIEFNLQRRV
jgi:geranylgeranyl diphosphate synthase type I